MSAVWPLARPVWWPTRWRQRVSRRGVNLMPWRQWRQRRAWRTLGWCWLLGGLVGAGAHALWRQSQAVPQAQWEQAQAQLRQQATQLQAMRRRVADWKKRWAWQDEQQALQAWRGQALRGLMGLLQTPPGPVLFTAVEWSGEHARASVVVPHPDLALPWLSQHWLPGQQAPWQTRGEWASHWVADGQWGGPWRGRVWQGQVEWRP
jgi:hypothetical protein